MLGVSLTGSAVISWGGTDDTDALFDANQPAGVPFPAGLGWTVTGSTPNRILKDPHGQKFAHETRDPVAPGGGIDAVTSEDESVTIVQTGRSVDLSAQSVGGSLPEGWTANDPDPGTLNAASGELAFTDGGIQGDDETDKFDISATQGVRVRSDTTEETYRIRIGTGIFSNPAADVPAFTAVGDAGGTVALDAGGLAIINLPAADPHIAGALWNDGGTPAISTG